MFEQVCFTIGYWFLIALSLFITMFVFCLLIKGISILLRKPYYCIKRLLPWKWVTEEEIKGIEKTLSCLYKDKNISLPKWKQDVKIIRKGRFGNLYIPNKVNWWDSKNHLFFIKKT